MKAKVNLDLLKLEPEQLENLKKLMELEDKSFSGDRATYEIKETDGGLSFVINADDAIALRACLTAITKTLSIFERTEKLVQEEN